MNTLPVKCILGVALALSPLCMATATDADTGRRRESRHSDAPLVYTDGESGPDKCKDCENVIVTRTTTTILTTATTLTTTTAVTATTATTTTNTKTTVTTVVTATTTATTVTVSG